MNYLRHIVLVFKRRLSDGKEFTTVIDADPTQEVFPHITFDLRIESSNPYPSGTISITNLHQLGQAALPGGICVIRAGYYREDSWPPVIFAGRPFSIETDWQGQDSKTTIGLGLPGELFIEVKIDAFRRSHPLRRILQEQGSSQIQFDSANLRDQLQYRGEEIRLPKGYAVGPVPMHEWLTDVLNNESLDTSHYWQYVPDDKLHIAYVQVFHQLRVDPTRPVRIRRIDMTGLPSPKIALDGDTGVDVETLLNHRLRLSSAISMEFSDPGRETSTGFSNWRPVLIEHRGDNFTGDFRSKISARAVL